MSLGVFANVLQLPQMLRVNIYGRPMSTEYVNYLTRLYGWISIARSRTDDWLEDLSVHVRAEVRME